MNQGPFFLVHYSKTVPLFWFLVPPPPASLEVGPWWYLGTASGCGEIKGVNESKDPLSNLKPNVRTSEPRIGEMDKKFCLLLLSFKNSNCREKADVYFVPSSFSLWERMLF